VALREQNCLFESMLQFGLKICQFGGKKYEYLD